MIYNFSYAFYTKNINIITYYIKQTLARKKTHKKFITNIENILYEFFKLFSNSKYSPFSYYFSKILILFHLIIIIII